MFKPANYHKRALSVVLAACVVFFATAYPAMAQVAPPLGTATSFAVLGGETVTNTGPTVVEGDLGVSPGSAVTGFPPGTVLPPGTIQAGNAVAAQAQADALAAYNNLAGQPCDSDLSGQDLGGQTLTTGVYCFDAEAQLTGPLTLDAEGDPDAVFIFQIGSTLTTASASSVNVINGGTGCNVFFQVGTSATLGTNTAFTGSIFANTSNTLNTGADITSGRALALNGSTTLDTNNISVSPCATPGTTTGGTTAGTTAGTTGGTTGGTTAGTTGDTTAGTTGDTTGGTTAGTTGDTTAGTTGDTTGGTTAGTTAGTTGGTTGGTTAGTTGDTTAGTTGDTTGGTTGDTTGGTTVGTSAPEVLPDTGGALLLPIAALLLIAVSGLSALVVVGRSRS